MASEFGRLLEAVLAGRVVVGPEEVSALERHCELMLKWNRTINLTAIRKIEEIVERHYAESVFAAWFLPEGRFTVADIGSGPGFPGIPMAVVRREAEVLLVESHQRKAVFLKEAVRGMANVKVFARRAEELGGEFDWLVSRAVSAEDLRGVLHLGRSVLLLSGEEAPPAVAGMEWESVALPWGQRRWVRIGRPTGR